MKNKQLISPIGLKGKEILERQLSLMGMKQINENENKTNSAVELTKIGPDGSAYAIVRENHEYYIKKTTKTTGLVLEDFKYIGGLQNKKEEAYPSYARAIKQLNFKFKSLAEAFNKGGDINVFEDDNLLSESGVAGFSSGSNNGFSGAGNLHGNEEMYKEEVYDEETLEEEEELNEFEQAIEEMMARNEEEEYVDYQMGRKNDPNQLPNPPREINIPENASEDIDHEAYDLVEFLKSKLVERGIDVTPENISIVSLAYPGGTITDLEKISSILSQTNEELHGGQQRLDIDKMLDEEWKSDFDGNRDFDTYNDDKVDFEKKYGSIYNIVDDINADITLDDDIDNDIFEEFFDNELNKLKKFNLPKGQNLKDGERIKFKSSPNGNTLSTDIYTLPNNKYCYWSTFKGGYLMGDDKEQIIKLAAIENKLFDISHSASIDKQTSRGESGWVDETDTHMSPRNKELAAIQEHKLSIARALTNMDSIIDSLTEGEVKKKVYTLK